MSTPAEESGEDEEVPAVEGQALTGPTHDPYSFKLLSLVQSQQSANGLRHNDHLRYRQYCTRRLRRLFNTLRFKHGRGRYKPAPFPEDFSDVRYLEIPMVNAERAWSYGVQLKADNAAASATNLQWKHHSIRRFSKAVKWAKMLESLCKIHGDQRTQLEAEAYAAFLEGVFLVEKEEWSEALTKIVRCRKLCEYLSVASEPEESAFLKAKAQELAPLLRECKYNLGEQFDPDDPDGDGAETSPSGQKQKQDLSGLSYRGHGLAIPSDKIKDKLLKCFQMANEVKVSEDMEESSSVIEKYGSLSVEFADVLRDIHGDMITAGADGQASEWRMLEAFAREISITMNVERNLVLLWNHLRKLEPLEEIMSPEARKECRPEEGMRFCDLLKEDLGSLLELPEADDRISAALSAYVTVVMNCRCLFLALCYTSLGKTLEAAALLDMLHARINDVVLGDSLQNPLGRLHALFERVQAGMPARVGSWRCRGLAHLCAAGGAAAGAAAAAGGGGTKGGGGAAGPGKGRALEEIANFAAFPPRFRDIPCKPLLFDLAFPAVEAPDFERVLQSRQSGADAQQKGLLGRVAGVAGGLGNRLGSLWGGRK